jgi:hypothetical protein
MDLNKDTISFLNFLIRDGAIGHIDNAWLEEKGCVLDDKQGIVMRIGEWLDYLEDSEDP